MVNTLICPPVYLVTWSSGHLFNIIWSPGHLVDMVIWSIWSSGQYGHPVNMVIWSIWSSDHLVITSSGHFVI